jgi:hypothetical protein
MTNDTNKTPTIGVNNFVRRQTWESEFTHFEDDHEALPDEDSWQKVLTLVKEHFHQAKPGYRDGVVLVPVPPDHFYTGLVTLKEGDDLVGSYEARRPGEEPRKQVWVLRSGESRNAGGGKERCRYVDVVLYRRDVLEEGGEECTGCDWDIISLNGRTTDEEAPIEPWTLMANHFELDGGTATGMSPEEFEADLRASVLYWKDKALLAP